METHTKKPVNAIQAILELSYEDNFRLDCWVIARRLGLSPREVKEAIGTLQRSGMLVKIGKKWKKTPELTAAI